MQTEMNNLLIQKNALNKKIVDLQAKIDAEAATVKSMTAPAK